MTLDKGNYIASIIPCYNYHLMKLSIDTLCVKEKEINTSGEAHILPLQATTAYSYKTIQDSIDVFTGNATGHVYSRYGNPTVNAVEDKLAKMESNGTALTPFCILTSSGMSAISTLCLSLLQPGDALLTQGNLYGGTTEVLKKVVQKNNVEIIIADLNNANEIEDTIKNKPQIKAIYFETPSNPTLQVVDISQLSAIAKKHNITTIIDNTFCTFYLQRPMSLGVDYVIYSTTKFLNGHGNAIGGAILGADYKNKQQVWEYMKLLGTNTNPWDAWLLHNGIKTLSVRMDRHCQNALAIANFLESHPKVKKVNYPGLLSNKGHKVATKQMSQYGGMLSFEIDGNLDDAKTFMDKTQLCTIAATLGNVDTLLLHPATSSHLNISPDQRLAHGVTDGLIRVSVGIENVDDLIADMKHALDLI